MEPRDYLSILSNEGLELNLGLILVSFFIGNDLSYGFLSQQDAGTTDIL